MSSADRPSAGSRETRKMRVFVPLLILLQLHQQARNQIDRGVELGNLAQQWAMPQ